MGTDIVLAKNWKPDTAEYSSMLEENPKKYEIYLVCLQLQRQQQTQVWFFAKI